MLSSFFKLYERLFFFRLNQWASGNKHLDANQFGFRKGRATFDAIFLLRELAFLFTKCLMIPPHVVFVDLIKAFPSVNRTALVKRLIDEGVPQRLVQAISSVFSFNSSRLKIGNRLTRVMNVNEGLREGGVLSPILFSIIFASVLRKLKSTFFLSAGTVPSITSSFFMRLHMPTTSRRFPRQFRF